MHCGLTGSASLRLRCTPLTDALCPFKFPCPRPSPEHAALFASPLEPLAEKVGARLRKHGVRLTLGGEPTLVPNNPEGTEWNFVAVGPDETALRLRAGGADHRTLPAGRDHGVFAGQAVSRRGQPALGRQPPRQPRRLAHRPTRRRPAQDRRLATSRAQVFQTLLADLAADLGFPPTPGPTPSIRRPAKASSPSCRSTTTARRWFTERWKLPSRRKNLLLLNAEGPAGLRLPLDRPPARGAAPRPDARTARRRLARLPAAAAATGLPRPARPRSARCLPGTGSARYFFEGYLPSDEANCLDPRRPDRRPRRAGDQRAALRDVAGLPPLARHPGGNRPRPSTCVPGSKTRRATTPARAAATTSFSAGRPWTKTRSSRVPAWVASLLRYFQAHPSLAYLFTGVYVGASSQAPRPDESARDLYDLDLGYEHLATPAAGRGPPLHHRRNAAPPAHRHHRQHPPQRDQLRQVLERRRPARRHRRG